jgi:glutamate formiminotransferase
VRLSDLRRRLGYFSAPFDTTAVTDRPDLGDLPLDVSLGLCCIGVVPLVVNFNMRFRVGDAKSSVAGVTRAVRGELVQALTLQHEGGAFEVACNLLNWRDYGPDRVLAMAKERATEEGVEVVSHYTTGPTEEKLLAHDLFR